jgi:hypothetical protein
MLFAKKNGALRAPAPPIAASVIVPAKLLAYIEKTQRKIHL